MKTPHNSQNLFFPPSFEQYAFGMLILGRWYAVYTLSKSLLQIVCPVLWKCIQKMPPCHLTGAAHYQNLCMGNLEEEIIGEGGSLRGTYVNTKIWVGSCPLTPPHSAIPAYAGEWQNSDNKSCVYGLRFSRIPQKTSKKPQNIDSILTSECKPHPQNPCPQPRLKVWGFSRANFKKPQS